MVDPFIRMTQYNKISDLVMTVGQNCVLKFNVVLNYEGKDGNIENFHKEFQYYSKRFSANQYTISRKFEYYLSLENSHPNDIGFKESIYIGVCEIMMFKFMIKSVMDWFFDPQYSDMYGNKDGRLVLMKSISPKRVVLRGKYVEIEPMVYIDQYESSDFGVRIYLNSDTNYTEIPFNRLCGLYYIIDSFNLYESAITLINYLQRPDLGTNLTSYIEGTKYEDIKISEQTPIQRSGRYIDNNIFKQKRKKLEDSLG